MSETTQGRAKDASSASAADEPAPARRTAADKPAPAAACSRYGQPL